MVTNGKRYVFRHRPITVYDLTRYEMFASETGLRGDILRQAWDGKMDGLEAISSKMQEPPPPVKKTLDAAVRERVQKLRNKANDRAVTPEESAAFHAKADALVEKWTN